MTRKRLNHLLSLFYWCEIYGDISSKGLNEDDIKEIFLELNLFDLDSVKLMIDEKVVRKRNERIDEVLKK